MIYGLDPVIHAPKRLAAMAILANSSSASFRILKEHLELNDSDLSKQMSALEHAGYVKSAKEGRGRGASTTYTLTKAGERRSPRTAPYSRNYSVTRSEPAASR